MKARATLLGHPIHQILIVLPLGLFVTAVVFDVVTMFKPMPQLSIAAFWNIVVGSIGALLAAPFGLIDWTKIPRKTRAKRVGILHAVTNVTVLSLFVVAGYLRYFNVDYAVTTIPLVLEIAGFLLAGLGGYLGGELVDRLGIGVHEGANPDAPGPLSRRPPLGATTGTPVPESHRAMPTGAM